LANPLALPLALQPHHDGSALYVPNQSPVLLDKIKVRIRIHDAIGKVKEVRVRFSESGEAFPAPPAKVIKREGGWSWYESTIVVHNPRSTTASSSSCKTERPFGTTPRVCTS
jgi:hypothetical protein